MLNVARKFVDGGYEDLAGLNIHDAVHVLATRYQLNKADLRSAVMQLYSEAAPAIVSEDYKPSYNAVIEGGEA